MDDSNRQQAAFTTPDGQSRYPMRHRAARQVAPQLSSKLATHSSERTPSKRTVPARIKQPQFVEQPEEFVASPQSMADLLAGSCSESIEAVIERYLGVGDVESAVYWTDTDYAKQCEESGDAHAIALYNYVRRLTRCREWQRIAFILESRHAQYTHRVFIFYYINALYHLKRYAEIESFHFGNLIMEHDKLLSIKRDEAPLVLVNSELDLKMSQTEAVYLNEVAEKNKILASLYLVLGQTYLAVENRHAAGVCLCKALQLDSKCLIAERLIARYGLSNSEEKFPLPIRGLEFASDPRTMTKHAEEVYARGDAAAAHEITRQIEAKFGFYRDCMLLHMNCLAQLADYDALFLLSQRLVDSRPEDPYSWYGVALYYYSTRQYGLAKNYMAKATSLSPRFGEAWLAFGHILAASCDSEQAQNCYFRAQRIMEGRYEPWLYVGVQHAKSMPVLAERFLLDANKMTDGRNAIVLHELAALFYAKRDYETAVQYALKAIQVIAPDDADLEKPINKFWQKLINNLGHIYRKLGKLEDAIKYHRKALMMKSNDVSALASLAMCHAASLQFDEATQCLHRAFALQPVNMMLHQIQRKIVDLMQLHTRIIPILPTKGGVEARFSLQDLSNVLEQPTGDPKVNSPFRSRFELRNLRDMSDCPQSGRIFNLSPIPPD